MIFVALDGKISNFTPNTINVRLQQVWIFRNFKIWQGVAKVLVMRLKVLTGITGRLKDVTRRFEETIRYLEKV